MTFMFFVSQLEFAQNDIGFSRGSFFGHEAEDFIMIFFKADDDSGIGGFEAERGVMRGIDTRFGVRLDGLHRIPEGLPAELPFLEGFDMFHVAEGKINLGAMVFKAFQIIFIQGIFHGGIGTLVAGVIVVMGDGFAFNAEQALFPLVPTDAVQDGELHVVFRGFAKDFGHSFDVLHLLIIDFLDDIRGFDASGVG